MTRALITDSLTVAEILETSIKEMTEKGLKPSSVMQSTFSVSEEFLRRIHRLKQSSGASFTLAIDRKALLKTHSLWLFVSNVYDKVYVADNHSKVILVAPEDPESTGTAVITSQNLTRGNRFESSIITDDSEIYFSLLRDFNSLIRNHSAPMHEIMKPVPDLKLPAPQETDPVKKQLDNIKRLASVFMSIPDIATIIEMPEAVLRDLIADRKSPESIAYRQGKAEAKLRIRSQEMDLASIGSPLGLQSVRDNLLEMESEE